MSRWPGCHPQRTIMFPVFVTMLLFLASIVQEEPEARGEPGSDLPRSGHTRLRDVPTAPTPLPGCAAPRPPLPSGGPGSSLPF